MTFESPEPALAPPIAEEAVESVSEEIADETIAEPMEQMGDDELVMLLESLLFVASEPTTIERLATALDVLPERVDVCLDVLQMQLIDRGIRVQRHNEAVQVVSAPEAADAIEAFLGLDLSTKLSRAALEVLAIIAYRQPATRPQIESIRGVSSDGVMRTLLRRGLIEEVGRLEQAGRPVLFGTTFEFLQYFGIENVTGLPPLDDDAVEELAARAEIYGEEAIEHAQAEAIEIDRSQEEAEG